LNCSFAFSESNHKWKPCNGTTWSNPKATIDDTKCNQTLSAFLLNLKNYSSVENQHLHKLKDCDAKPKLQQFSYII